MVVYCPIENIIALKLMSQQTSWFHLS
jgi:hypothetical protein